MKTLHDRVISAGCFFFVAAFLASIAWVGFAGFRHVTWVLAALAGGLLLGRYNKLRLDRAVQSIADSAFLPQDLELPMIERSGHYGFPVYRLLFSSKEAEQAAMESGALTSFKSGIQELHGAASTQSRPFDAELAVATTHPGKDRIDSAGTV